MELSAPPVRPLLGQALLERGQITPDQLRIALHEQAREHRLLGQWLIHLGFLSEHALRDTLSAVSGLPYVDFTHASATPQAISLIPEALARRHCILPLDWCADSRVLTFASAYPENIITADQIAACLPPRTSLRPCFACESDLLRALDQHYGFEHKIDTLIAELEAGSTHSPTHSGTDAASSPVARLIDALITCAVKRQASDLHFEPAEHTLHIRYRIDGQLRQLHVLHSRCWPPLVVRLKVMANLNIAENRIPQDGRLSFEVSGRPIDVRIAIFPTLHGENIVLRLLDRQHGIQPIETLGLAPESLSMLRLMLKRPEGLLLVTGPTGSGKTTTLYSVLAHLDAEHVSIMTLEDPVEYPMTRIRQSAVSDASRMSFAEGVRALLRQDPDILLIGEIRDAETAEMALRAAMTGHQVHATLHAGSALSALPRLRELGASPGILAGNLIGILAQRLVRRLCSACRQARAPTATERALLADQTPAVLYDPGACVVCDQQGYRGRLALVEILRIDAALDELIARGATRHELETTARRQGFIPLAEAGLQQLAQGNTTLDELARVIDLTPLLALVPCATPSH